MEHGKISRKGSLPSGARCLIMKKYCLAIIAVLTAFVFVFAGCGGQNGGKNNGGASVTVAPTPQIADGTGYDNSVTITDGAVNGTSFNWQFFLGKSGAGRSAEIKLIVENGGSKEEMDLKGGNGSFTLKRGNNESTYTYLLSFTADFPASTEHSMAEISVLTNNPDITIEEFFGGAVPEDARVGDVNGNGVVVFTDYKAK